MDRWTQLTDGVVVFRPLDLGDVAEHLAGEDEALVRWLNGGPGTRETVEAHMRASMAAWEAGGPTITFGIRAGVPERLVGTVDAHLELAGLELGQANIAFGLYPHARGHGLAPRPGHSCAPSWPPGTVFARRSSAPSQPTRRRPQSPSEQGSVWLDAEARANSTGTSATSQRLRLRSPCTAAGMVTRIQVMTTTTSLANVKAHLSAIVGSVHDTHERVVITRNGEPAAVLVSPDDLASLEESLDILSDAALMAQIAEARAEIDAGETVELPSLRRR